MHPMHWRKTKITDPQNGGDLQRDRCSVQLHWLLGTVMMSQQAQISEPSYKTGNDPGKPELMR